jgi:hypothetical protein
MQRNKGLTLVECLVIMVVLLIIAAILMPVSGGSHQSLKVRCLSNLKQLTLSCLIYANDYDDRMPIATTWSNGVEHYTKSSSVFHDPEGVPDGGYGYGFRLKASSVKESAFGDPPNFILMFDSTIADKNAHSELWSMPTPGRHHGNDSLTFVDGHARSVQVSPDGSDVLRKIKADDAKAGLGPAHKAKILPDQD